MKRFIFAIGWILIFTGCDRSFTDRFDVPSAEIEGMDEAALPEDVQAQLTEIDQKLARIDSQLDQRLGAIERRLLNVEQAGPIAAGDGLVPATDQLARDQLAGGQLTGDQTAGGRTTAGHPTVDETASAVFAHSASAAEHEYVGPSLCAPCHLPQYISWQKTKMAHAFEALKPGMSVDAKLKANMDPNKDYTEVTACVGCHVTGYGQKGGFVDIATTPDMAGVTCEACHGPAGSYMAKGLKKNPEYKKADLVAEGMVDAITVEQCQGCHNINSPMVDADYVFDFAANKDKGTHEHFPLKFEH